MSLPRPKRESIADTHEDRSLFYSIWGVRHPTKFATGIISTIELYPRWEYIKEGSSNKRCLANIDKKVFSQIELRDSTGKTVSSMTCEPILTIVRRQDESSAQ